MKIIPVNPIRCPPPEMGMFLREMNCCNVMEEIYLMRNILYYKYNNKSYMENHANII